MIERPRGDRPAPLAAGAHAEDGRAATFLFRDAKPLAAADKSRRPAVAGRRSGRSPYPSARSGHQRTRRVGLVETEGRRQGGFTRHTTKALRWHSIGRIRVIAIENVAGEKDAGDAATRVGGCAAGAAGKDPMAAEVTWRSCTTASAQPIYASLVETEDMRTPIASSGLPYQQRVGAGLLVPFNGEGGRDSLSRGRRAKMLPFIPCDRSPTLAAIVRNPRYLSINTEEL